MQNSSEYPDHLSVLSRTLWCFFFPTTFLEIAVYLGEIKGKNLARLAHFFVVVEYFYQDPLAQENQQPLQYKYHDIK